MSSVSTSVDMHWNAPVQHVPVLQGDFAVGAEEVLGWGPALLPPPAAK